MKTVKFTEEQYESLCNEMFQAMGNLSRYMHKCGLTKYSLIEGCTEPEEYAALLVQLMDIGDDEVAKS